MDERFLSCPAAAPRWIATHTLPRPRMPRLPAVRALACALAIAAVPATLTGQGSGRIPSQPYRWKNVQIVGGGFVSGIVFHPTAQGVRYARTDIGGAYRWNRFERRWEPLLDWIPYEDRNLMGVESIALDPSDPKRLYLALGTYTAPGVPDGAILRSDDQGATFRRTNVPFKLGANESGRGNGERMAVDPNDGRVIYLGTRHAGLWRSRDRGATWARVATFPDVSEGPEGKGAGIVFVAFDPRGGSTKRPRSIIYAGASLMGRDNLFRSTDGGTTWKAVPGQPTAYRPNHAVFASSGLLYVSYGTDPGPMPMVNGAVWKLDPRGDTWTNITPDRPDPQKRPFGYVAVAIDPSRPNRLIASSFGRPGGEEIFRSTDGGRSWKPIFGGGGTYDFAAAPYVAATPIHWLFDIEIDPSDPDHALFTTGYGGYETFDLTDADAGRPTKWSVMSTGIEESVALALASPWSGAHLVSAIGDYAGFVHWDLDRPAAGNFANPRFGNTHSLGLAPGAPDLIVRVGRPPWGQTGPTIGYTLDGGRSWSPAPLPTPDSRAGEIAVSADGTSWLWTPEGQATYLTRDRGLHWTGAAGLSGSVRITADGVDPRRFYALDLFGGKLFVSADGGSTFQARALALPAGAQPHDPSNRGDDRGGQDRLYATPGRTGDLWLAAFDGLYHSTDGGESFGRLPRVREIHAFGFGAPAVGAPHPAIFLVGVIDGLRGIFRSDDAARTWVRINDDQHQWGLVLHVTGDPRIPGRVYVGTHGRGLVYGDPVTPGG